jgi:hypothetical protein
MARGKPLFTCAYVRKPCDLPSALKYWNHGWPSSNIVGAMNGGLTMRLSDAGMRRHPTKLIYFDHRSSPWLTEDATPRSLELLLDPARSQYANSRIHDHETTKPTRT